MIDIGIINGYLQLVIYVGSVVALIATVQKTLARPNQSQNERLDSLEKWRDSIDGRMMEGDNHFRSIDEGTRITQASLLALMSHAINGNDIDKLEKARDELQDYLVRK